MRQKIYVLERPSVCPDCECAVKALERAACRPVHQWEGDDGCSENSAVPCHYKFNAELHQKDADWALCAENEQQKIAAYRRRQYHGKRENNVKNTLDRARQSCRIVGEEYAREKTITQLIAAMRREFISGYQSMFILYTSDWQRK